MKKIIVAFFVFYNILLLAQPLQVNTIVQENKITEFTNQKLILLDFWATWCGPCIPATQQLEVFQSENKSDVFIVSISDESNEKITKFLAKKPIDLMVIEDDKGNTFDKFKVERRPYAVLLNTKGQLLWEGHPSDLSQSKLKNFVRKNSSLPNVQLEEVFKVMNISTKAEKIEIDKFTVELSNDTNFQDYFYKEDGIVNYNGSIANLIAELLETPKQMIRKNFEDFKVDFKANSAYFQNNKSKILKQLCSQFNLNVDKEKEKVSVIELMVEDASKLWSNDSFQWSEGDSLDSNFLLGDDVIQGDNLTIEKLAELLSDARNEVYVYKGKDTTKYDWDLHYKYDELFKESLLDNFGISLKTDVSKISKYVINKKE